jgi:hypothetical protein
MILSVILHPERASRLVSQHALDNKLPGLDQVIDKIINSCWKNVEEIGYHGEIKRIVDIAVLKRLIILSTQPAASPQVKAIVFLKLTELKKSISSQTAVGKSFEQKAHQNYALLMLNTSASHISEDVKIPLNPPNGPPIGSTYEKLKAAEFCGY